jgi:hypothetical protein
MISIVTGIYHRLFDIGTDKHNIYYLTVTIAKSTPNISPIYCNG